MPNPSPETVAAVAERWAVRLGVNLSKTIPAREAEKWLADHRNVARAIVWARELSPTLGSAFGKKRNRLGQDIGWARHIGWDDPTAAMIELDAVLLEVEPTSQATGA